MYVHYSAVHSYVHLYFPPPFSSIVTFDAVIGYGNLFTDLFIKYVYHSKPSLNRYLLLLDVMLCDQVYAWSSEGKMCSRLTVDSTIAYMEQLKMLGK